MEGFDNAEIAEKLNLSIDSVKSHKKRGKQLLEKSQLSISQIAYQVGLSPKQFAKYFKEEYGCLPSEYN